MHAAKIAPLPALLFSGLFSAHLAAQDPTPVQVETEIYSVTVNKKPKTKGTTLFGQEGFEIKLAAKLEQAVISLDKKATKLNTFVDDAGTDLSQGADKGFFYWVKMNEFFNDKKPKGLVNLTVRTKTLPAAKAGRVKLDATVVIITAGGTDQAEQKLSLKKDAKVTTGPVPMKISRVKAGKFGDSKIEIQFQSETSFDPIQKFEFVGSDGKVIKTDNRGSGSFGFGDKMTYSKSFALATKSEDVTLRLTFHKDLKKVALPLKLDFGLGLGK